MLGSEKAADLPNRREVEPLGIRPRGLIFLEPSAEGGEDLGLEVVEIVAANCFAGRNIDPIAVVHMKHSAADSDMVVGPGAVAPRHDGNLEGGQEVGVSGQDAEGAGLVLRPKMRDIVDLDDERERCSDAEPHAAPFSAIVSLLRASSRSPTM